MLTLLKPNSQSEKFGYIFLELCELFYWVSQEIESFVISPPEASTLCFALQQHSYWIKIDNKDLLSFYICKISNIKNIYLKGQLQKEICNIGATNG